MTTEVRPKSTPFKSRSFVLDKRSTISTRQTARSPTKSFYTKSKMLNESKKDLVINPMSESVPIELYFNPDFRHKYVKKVIDSFFVNMKDSKNMINPESRERSMCSSKIGLRSKMKQWRKKTKLSSDIEEIDSTKFIRSSPKKSILSEFQEQKSLSIIEQKNMIQLKSSINNELHDNFIGSNTQSISISSQSNSNSHLFRPYSVQNKRRQSSKEIEQNKSINSINVSVFFNEGKSPREKMRKELRKLVDFNHYFHEFNVFEDGKLKAKVRKYTHQANELFLREEKIFKRGIKTLWKYSKFPLTLQYPLLKSVQEQLGQSFHYGSTELDSYAQIYPKPYYTKLFLNKNEELIDIIVSMTKFILECKGKVLTNAFNSKNLYKIGQKQFYLKDLGSSAISESIKIREKRIKHLYPPIFRQEESRKKWLIRPQYLSPEIIESYKNSEYSWVDSDPDAVMSSQVWSLGCMILQILTLIPLNSDIRSRIKTNPDHTRRGFLSIKFNESFVDFDLLQRKQKFLQNIIARKIESELENVPLEKRVLQVLKKMLIYDSKNRIKPDQIISELKI